MPIKLLMAAVFGVTVVACQAGVAHTVGDHAEIKLLKILEDVGPRLTWKRHVIDRPDNPK
jgi:hypothetical protein